MTSKNIREMYFIIDSSRKCLDKKYMHSLDDYVDKRCSDFCKEHNINITHGNAYKELVHKFNYYKIKCINSILNNGIDLYELRQFKIVKDKDIVDRYIKMRLKHKT